MNGYIGIMNDTPDLMGRTHGSALLENTFIAELLKMNSVRFKDMSEQKIEEDIETRSWNKKMVHKYLKSDLVIRITYGHYFCIISMC